MLSRLLCLCSDRCISIVYIQHNCTDIFDDILGYSELLYKQITQYMPLYYYKPSFTMHAIYLSIETVYIMHLLFRVKHGLYSWTTQKLKHGLKTYPP